mmetsp:Transcript_19143/g.45950  ORF Transcript_19143/g.45950 Transcript_19143/m.45950 type:complete len:238 (+) Transcript_19143:614-1327(+)
MCTCVSDAWMGNWAVRGRGQGAAAGCAADVQGGGAAGEGLGIRGAPPPPYGWQSPGRNVLRLYEDWDGITENEALCDADGSIRREAFHRILRKQILLFVQRCLSNELRTLSRSEGGDTALATVLYDSKVLRVPERCPLSLSASCWSRSRSWSWSRSRSRSRPGQEESKTEKGARGARERGEEGGCARQYTRVHTFDMSHHSCDCHPVLAAAEQRLPSAMDTVRNQTTGRWPLRCHPT